ncbi:MAG: DNA mismatch repair protein MutL, partial [Ruminococcus sp.]
NHSENKEIQCEPEVLQEDDKTEEMQNKSSIKEQDKEETENNEINVIGEIFKNYILAESGEKLLIFDKHAAHERVIFERLKSGSARHSRQMLMTPVRVLLGSEETDAIQNNVELLSGMGFSFEFVDSTSVLVTGIPTFAQNLVVDELITEIARNLVIGKMNPEPSYLDDTLHSIACKAAIKANDRNDITELQSLVNEVYNNENIRHCPHGRPVMFVITKHELEKQFGRT